MAGHLPCHIKGQGFETSPCLRQERDNFQREKAGNTKGGSIAVLLTSCLTGLYDN